MECINLSWSRHVVTGRFRVTLFGVTVSNWKKVSPYSSVLYSESRTEFWNVIRNKKISFWQWRVKLGISPQESLLGTQDFSHEFIRWLWIYAWYIMCKKFCPKSGIVIHVLLPHWLMRRFFTNSCQCRRVKLYLL